MDADLVVRAQQGDQRAFEMLAADAYHRLYRLAHGILRDGAKADDATQQALVSIWRNLPRLRDPARFEGWSCRLLVNACHDQVRRTPTWASSATLPRSAEPVAHDDISPVADHDALERALGRVSFDQRTVLALRFLLDRTPDEIAETLSIPRKTVYSRLKRGVASMRAAMEAEIRPVMSGAASGEAVR
jgi:RNA polymerase sigma-70 factor (ECF subfamily)